MTPKGRSIILLGIFCFPCTDARRQIWPAFLVRVPAGPRHLRREHTPAHGCSTAARRGLRNPVFSTTDEAVTTQQLSDLDARVIDELLSDPAFLETLVRQGVQLEEDDGWAGMVANSTAGGSTNGGALTKAREVTLAAGSSSGYESVTMQFVEEVQDSLKAAFAKVSAAFESAGIYVANRAQMDTKVIQAVVDYASKQAAARTGRLLLAASGAASPALLMLGINTTETQAALNDSIQLLSMGIVPDSVGLSPKLLTSFKDFDDDDKRLDAAYRRQRRRRSKPLPARLLGSLPSTVNKAADFAYEVEQEVKYERAGRRANNLLRPLGLSLPSAEDSSLLLGGPPGGSTGNLLEVRDALGASTAADSSTARDRGSYKVTSSPAVGVTTEAKVKGPLLLEASARRESRPPTPGPWGMASRLRRRGANAQSKQKSPDEAKAIPAVETALAAMLISHFGVLADQISKCIGAVDEELRLHKRGLKAANAVLCSTEPVVAGLEEILDREVTLLEELRNVAGNVQKMYVLAEMTDALEAAEAYVRRLEALLSNVLQLTFDLKAFVATTNARIGRLVAIGSALVEARDLSDIQDETGEAKLQLALKSLELLQSFDNEVIARQREAEAVGRPLSVVWRESAERARDDIGYAHEHALVAACRLWKASAIEGTGNRGGAIDGIRLELAAVEEIDISASPVMGAGRADPTVGARKAGLESLPNVAGQELEAEEAGAQLFPGGKGAADPGIERSNPGVGEAQAGKGVRAASPASVGHIPQVQIPVYDVRATVVTTSPDHTPATTGAETDSGTQMNLGLNLSPVSDYAVDAVIVSESTGMRSSARPTNGQATASLSKAVKRKASGTSSIEVVVDGPNSFLDVEGEVKDDLSDPTRVGLKILDVCALLIEKVIFVGVPTLVSGASLVWERVDNAVNGAKGRRGWRLLKRLRKDSLGPEDK